MAIPTQQLPVGFRFQPTDEEVFHYYLVMRNMGVKSSTVVPDIDLTMLEPWELPLKFKDSLSYQGNDNEWWFFSARTRNQTTRRKTGSGKWTSTCKDKKIMDGDKDQIRGIRKDLAFHSGQCPPFKRLNWILHEHHLTDDHLAGLPLPDKNTYFVLCRLNKNKDDRAKNNTGGEVGQAGSFEIDQQEVQQTDGEILSQAQRQRKRRMESTEASFRSVNQFTSLEQQMRPQDNLLSISDYLPQSSEICSNVPHVASFGSNSSTLDPSWSSNSGSGASGCLDFSRDIPGNSLEDQDVLSYSEQLQMEMVLPDLVSTFGSLPHQVPQGGPVGDMPISAQQSPHIMKNRRAQSTKSLSGVVLAAEKETTVENRNARIVKEHPAAANPAWKKTSTTNIEEDEKLAQEIEEKLRLECRPRLKKQNQNSSPFPRSKCLANLAVGLVLTYLICRNMLYL